MNNSNRRKKSSSENNPLKKTLLALTSCVLAFSLIAAFSPQAGADYGITNRIKGEDQNNEILYSPVIVQGGPSAILGTKDGRQIVYPRSDQYYAQTQTMYVDAPKKNSIFGYKQPKNDKDHVLGYPYHGVRVAAIAEQGEYTCILYRDNMNADRAAWVVSSELTYTFPGIEQTVGMPLAAKATNLGDVRVSWSKDNFVGTGQKYTVLSQPVYGCIQFTLDYQVIGRGNAGRIENVYGRRSIYVNDGTGWELVGSFEYDELNTVHVTVNLTEPVNLLAVATVADCAKPDAFNFRQCVLDVLKQ